ncbi:MAG: UDP-N-acetylglucosamine 2-epimerase (non-hydrolyzing) [Candidatus Kapaibacteriales bacterium]
MKVAPIDREFRKVKYQGNAEHSIVHTGQHYDHKMSGSFFEDLEMPEPKFYLKSGAGSHAKQTADIMLGMEKVLLEYNPDLLIVVGDVNSTVAAALTAIKMHIKTAHVESGLRSGDRAMPEEINRIATDAIVDYCFVTEQSGVDNLISENRNKDTIFHVGNTMIDSVLYARKEADSRKIWEDIGLQKGEYVLSTIHRPSNVDNREGLELIFDVFEYLSKKNKKVLLPLHPRTKNRIEELGLATRFGNLRNLVVTEPMSYISFQSAMIGSDFVLTDSGGIQEETTALSVDCMTARTTTERPITITLGSNILVPPTRENLYEAIDDYLSGKRKKSEVPELWDGKASERIAEKIMELI